MNNIYHISIYRGSCNEYVNILYVLAIREPVLNRISLSPGYLEMLRCDDSNQQARQSLSIYISFNCWVI